MGTVDREDIINREGVVGFDALGSIELTSIAVGFHTVDAMVKAAPVIVLAARSACPGKFFILITGDVASVQEAVAIGVSLGGKSVTGSFMIANLDRKVIPAVNRGTGFRVARTDRKKKSGTGNGPGDGGVPGPRPVEAFGVIETFSAASLVRSADAAVKNADVFLESVNLLNGLGGKAYCVLSGPVTDVEAGVEAGCAAVDKIDLADAVIIPRAHPDIVRFFPG